MSRLALGQPPRPPLLGREQEIELLEAFLDRFGSTGSVTVLSGEAGVGKTVLLDFAAEAAAARGVQVLRAAGVEFEAEVSFLGLNQLLFPLRDRIEERPAEERDGLLNALGLGDGQAAGRLLICNATLALLSAVAAQRPILLVVDDLPWLDRASAGVLGFLARRLGPGIGFLGATRSDERGFFERRGLPQHRVEPLDEAAAQALLREHFPALAGSVRRRLLDEGEGNPLAMLELAEGLSAQQRSALMPLPSTLPSGGRLRSLFSSRVSKLPAATRELLLAAVLDGRGDLRRLQAAAPGSPVLDDLAPAERARLIAVEETSHLFAFRHPLIRSAVVDLSTSADRRRLHRVLSKLADQSSERRAWHLAEATIEPDEMVAALLEEAARDLLRRGEAVGAVRALVRAGELSPDGVDRSRRLAVAAYMGADVTGELRNARVHLAEARGEDPGSEGSLELAVAAAYLLLNSDGDVRSAHRILVGAIDAGLQPQANGATMIEALHTFLRVCFFMGRPEGWEPFLDFIARIEPPLPLSLRLCVGIYPDPTAAGPELLAELDEANAALEQETDPTEIVRLGVASIYVDRLDDCEAALRRVAEDGRTGGAVASAINALMLLAFADLPHGRWDLAARHAEDALELCESQGYRLLSWPGRLAQGLIAAARGDFERARCRAEEMSEWAGPREVRAVEHYAAQVRTMVALGEGDFEGAFLHASSISPAGELGPNRAHALWVAMDLIEAAVRSGRPAEARAHVDAIRGCGVGGLSPRLALHAAGAVAMAAPLAEAAPLFERAIGLPGAATWAFDFARIRLAFGESLRRTRAAQKARAELGSALQIFEELGARPWARRAEVELHATAARKWRGGDPRAPLLTPQEFEIANLAAQGLTNKEIGARLNLSHRTVSAHLYRIFPKLEITSRAMLRDALSALPTDDDRGPGRGSVTAPGR